MLELIGSIVLKILASVALKVAERMMPPQYRWLLVILSFVL
jgi:hypothetical protein